MKIVTLQSMRAPLARAVGPAAILYACVAHACVLYAPTDGFTGGHQMAADSKGNLYTALGNRPRKFTFKSMSPK